MHGCTNPALHRQPMARMSSSSPPSSSQPSDAVLAFQIGSDPPTLLKRDAKGNQFAVVLCFFCNSHNTQHRCVASVPNGGFTYISDRICGRPFCHNCSLGWGLENRTRCIDHKDIGEKETAPPMPPFRSRSRVEEVLIDPPYVFPAESGRSPSSAGNGGTNLPDNSSTTTVPNAPAASPPPDTSDDPMDNDNSNENDAESDDFFDTYAVGQIYEKKAFIEATRVAANRMGFEIAVRGTQVCCSRASRNSDGPKAAAKKESVPDEKKRKKSSHAVGCKWVIRWQRQRENIPSSADYYLRITSFSLDHTNGCTPSKQQLRLSRRRSGSYTRNIPMNALKERVLLLGDRERVPYSLVRKLLKPFFPDDWVMDSASICNFLVKCRYFKQELERRNDTLSISKDVPGWIQMANTDPADFVSKASRYASEMLMDTIHNPGNVWEAEQVMKELKRIDPGFDYRIARQNDNKPTGIVWVTTYMRRNYELGGFCLFLDAMKRQQNDINWPYMSVVVLNNMKKIANACEALTCAEKIVAYR